MSNQSGSIIVARKKTKSEISTEQKIKKLVMEGFTRDQAVAMVKGDKNFGKLKKPRSVAQMMGDKKGAMKRSAKSQRKKK